MTDDSIQSNVADELRLADSALRAARLLLDQDLLPDAASRAYYAALHAARALLFSVGIESHSHRALRTLVSRHFVRAGKLDSGLSKDLAQLEALRTAGDYDTTFALEADDVRPEVERAARFVGAARACLAADGWLD